jgi:hypothetical protein
MTEHRLMTTIVRDGRQLAITLDNVAKVGDLILQDRRLTTQDLCNTLGLSYGTCQRATATGRRIVAPTFAERGVSSGQSDGSPTVVNLSFLDRSR